VTWRCGFGVDMHLLKGSSDVEIRISVCNEAVALIHADTILEVELDYTSGFDGDLLRLAWTLSA
jgi:hypothetical protein